MAPRQWEKAKVQAQIDAAASTVLIDLHAYGVYDIYKLTLESLAAALKTQAA